MLIVLDGFDQQHLTFKFLWRFCDKLGRTCTAVEQLGFHTIFHQNTPTHSFACWELQNSLWKKILLTDWHHSGLPFHSRCPHCLGSPSQHSLNYLWLTWVKSANTWFTKERLWVAAVGKNLDFWSSLSSTDSLNRESTLVLGNLWSGVQIVGTVVTYWC